MTVAVQKGTQAWCDSCNRSYNGLVQRWAKSRKLREWWNNLQPPAQQAWFRKWGSLSVKKRFACLNYVEETIHAAELLEDEIDKWITIAKYKKEHPCKTKEVCEREFQEIVDANKSECLFRRDEWLIPTFEGVERIKRRRKTQAWSAGRSSEIDSAKELAELMAGGSQLLDRYLASLPDAIITPTSSTEVSTIRFDSNPGDQPMSAAPQDLVIGAIQREAFL